MKTPDGHLRHYASEPSPLREAINYLIQGQKELHFPDLSQLNLKMFSLEAQQKQYETRDENRMPFIIPEVLEPMKAKADDKAIEAAFRDPKYIAQRKLDGWRYRLQKDHLSQVKCLSYGTQVIKKVDTGKPVDKTEHVPHLVKWALEYLPAGSLLDGEIITHKNLNCESHDVTRFLGCDPEKAIQRQEEEGYLTFAIIDIPFMAGVDLTSQPWTTRQTTLEKLYSDVWGKPEDFILLDYIHCDPEETAIEYYEKIVETGGEGVLLKHVDTPYIWGGRPKEWQKVKKYKTFDVVVMGFAPPEREYKGKALLNWPYWEHAETGKKTNKLLQSVEDLKARGFIPVTKRQFFDWPGSVRYGQYVKDEAGNLELKELGTFSGMDEEVLSQFGKDPESFINTVIEVGAMRQNKRTGALVLPRFKQIRPDKKHTECILGEC